MADQAPHLDLDQARRRLEGARGEDLWRSLEELAGAEGFEEMLQRELPRQAGGWPEGVDRRQFLKLMGASLALAGLTGCGSSPREPIVPYTTAPEEMLPGRPLYFATAMPLAGYGSGLLVVSHEGRPTKVEGNPDHPTGRLPEDSPGNDLRPGDPRRPRFGPSDLFAQASILTLYDPDRAQAVSRVSQPTTWESFAEEMSRRARGRERDEPNPNLRLRILTETVTSPSLAQQIRDVLARFPRAGWHVYEPAGHDNARLGAQAAFGEPVEPVYDLTRADVILSLEADFLSCGRGHLRHVRDFAARRRVRQGTLGEGRPLGMSRLYVVESTPSNTGAKADHRWPLRAAQVQSFALAVAAELGVAIPGGSGPAHGLPAEVVRAVAADLRRAAGAGLVLAGQGQPPLVHALAHAINDRLGSAGPEGPVHYVPAVEVRPDDPEDEALREDPAGSLRQLARDMENGQVDLLLILGGNPVYSAPADLPFARALGRVPLRVHLSLHEDETSGLCHWHIPEAHYLETWGDVRAHDGTVSIIQPLIAPLYGGRSAHEVLALFTGHPERTAYEVVRAYWRFSGDRVRALPARRGSPARFPRGFEAWWRKAIHDGFAEGTAASGPPPTLQPSWSQARGLPQGAGQGLEVVFRPDPTLFDGRFANNGWLQELPRPLSKITWDNAAYLSPATAVRQGLAAQGHPEQANGKVVSLRVRAGGQELAVEAPVIVLPGHADDSVTLHLGGGRARAGRVGTGVGFNANRVRTSAAFWFGSGVTLQNRNRAHQFAITQHHHTMRGREIVRDGELRRTGGAEGAPARVVMHEPIQRAAHEPRRTWPELPTLFPEHPYDGNKWGMSIDQTLCTGCSACIVACQAENNIPVVGKEQVIASREMHWLRVDTYYKGSPERPQDLKTFFQPVPCMQCENAPCELVCPVAATAHSHDGLNDMAYNRCVGTRYCSNNCPYKVRRFNFLQYADWDTESLRAMRNPDVTVRSRGVMEKCTYCVQRIRHGQIQAQLRVRPGADGRDEQWVVHDGEVQTACQSACPAGAIVFGDLNGDRDERGNPQSRVAQLQAEPLNYGLLFDLNTRPRTTYRAAVSNPNPQLRPEGGHR
jgi:MoCo/4Fe-4S cofactor protein with predicted Tat translocation signal